MVWEDKNIVVEGGEVDSSDEESDVPEDDFDADDDGGSGGEKEVEENSDSDEEGNDSSEASDDGDKNDISAPIVIGQDNDNDDESDISEDDRDTLDNNESDDESKENDEHETDEEDDEGNVGWADAMKKVLAMGKNSEKTVSVLSKAKKDNAKQKTVGIGSDGEEVEKKYEPLALRKARKKEIDSIGRKMPDVLERNAEKAFAKIATRGVVQLFNAVREQQKDIKSQLKEAGGSFRKQEKVFKNIDKNSFVELLTGKSISKPLSEPPAKKPKTEVKDENDENQSSWNILRDDFMLGAKMRDWDKESDGE